MTTPFAILGARHGRLLVASSDTSFGDRYAVQQGDLLVRFSHVSEPVARLARGQSLLAHPNHEPAHWSVDADPADVVLTSQVNEAWAVDGRRPWLLAAEPSAAGVTVTYRDSDLGTGIPVIPGRNYLASGLFACHQASGRLVVTVLDAEGHQIEQKKTPLTNEFRGGQEPSAYQRATVRLKMPDDAHRAVYQVELVEHVPEPAATSDRSMLFFLDCALVLAPGAEPEWTPRAHARSVLARAVAGGREVDVYEAPVEVGAASRVDEVAVVDLDNDAVVDTFQPAIEAEAQAEIRRLKESFAMVAVTGTRRPLGLYVDGEFAGPVRYPRRKTNDGSTLHGRVPLPPDKCDGEPHLVEVRDETGTRVLDRTYDVLPTTTTSWNALRRLTRPPLPSQLAPAAGHRYQGLIRNLEKAAAGALDPEQVQQLYRVHHAVELGFDVNRDFGPLHFPKVPEPDVSVVVPVHNKFSVTYNCLASLLLAANDVSFEIVVVDDGSSDETVRLGELAPNITVCRNETAQGFVGACNLGAEHARGRYLVLLNNDTEPTAGWLDELVDAFDRFDHVGMVGSKLVYPNGRLQDAGGIVWGNGNPWNYGRGQNAADPRYCYARQADYLTGAALMISSSVWKEVGGLSTEFAPAYFEDTDLAFKVRDAGYTTWFVPSSVVVHFEGLSHGTEVTSESGFKRFQEINRPKFQQKWADAVAAHGDEGVRPDLEKDRGITGRTLFIDHGVPQPDRDAGSYAAIQEMRLVQALGHKVTFLPLNLSWIGSFSDTLNRSGIETVQAPFTSSIEAFLEDRGSEFDAIYITRYNVAEKVLDAVRRFAPDAKTLFCNADLHFLREARAMLSGGGDDADWESTRLIRESELDIMRKVDLVLSYNEVEHAVILSHNLGEARVATCPWVVEEVDPRDVPSFEARDGVAFLGGYGHPPNVEAVDYFLENVLPKLRDRLPGMRFNIYGSQMPERFTELADDVINPVGWVQSVEEVYHDNRVFVAPLLSGAGIKGKVLGAMAHGLPSVLSPVAAESTGLRDGYDAIVARDADEWVDGVAELYSDPERWQAMSASAMDFTHRTYSFEHGLRLMGEAFVSAGVTNVADPAAQPG